MSYLIKTPMELERLYNGTLSKQFKGGSSGGGEREATAEEKRLWASQAASLEGLNQVALPNLATGMSNLGTLTNESMDGTLAARLRGMAGADASAAMGQGLTGATQKLERFGSTLNPNALSAQLRNTALQGGAMKAAAMNQANIAAEDTKWNRNAALTGLASGQGAQAINGMGSLAGQITADRNNANNMAMQNQSNNMQGLVGLGSIGAYMMKKDGGEIRLADGGGNLRPYKPVSIKLSPWSFQDSGTPAQPDSGMMQTVAGVATPIMGTKMAADGLAKIGIGAPKKALDGVVSSAKDVVSSLGTNSTFAPIAEEKALEAAGTFGGENAAWAAGELAADAELAGSATTAAATEGFGAALGAAAPWLAGGYALGSILDLWADGGPVPKEGGLRRKDMRKGGKVNGPGTSVSDSIPARLSDGEYVLNTEAVKMIGKQKLDALNNAGLRKRYGKDAPKSESYVQGAGEQKFGMGGLAALGHIARGFVPTAMQMDQQKKYDERWAAQDARADAAEGRASDLHTVTMDKAQREQEEWDQINAPFKALSEEIRHMRKTGSYKPVADFVYNTYNQQVGAQNDGKQMFFQTGKDGNFIGTIKDKDGNMTPFNVSRDEGLEMYAEARMKELAFDNPALFKQWYVKKVKEKEAERASILRKDEKLFDHELGMSRDTHKGNIDASLEANKPLIVPENSTVLNKVTGETYTPGGAGGMNPGKSAKWIKDYDAWLRNQLGIGEDEVSGQFTGNPEAVATYQQRMQAAADLLQNGHQLTYTDINAAVKPTTAYVVDRKTGKGERVPAYEINGYHYLLDRTGRKVRVADAKNIGVDPAGKARIDALTERLSRGQSNANGRPVRQGWKGKISKPGLAPVPAPQRHPTTPADFPSVSGAEQGERDALAAELRIEEVGGPEAATERAAVIRDELATDKTMGGDKRRMLKRDLQLLESGLAAMREAA